MHKVSDVLAEIFSQDPLETYFCKQHPPGALKNKQPLYDFGCANAFRNQKVFKPIATGTVSDENINPESDRTSSMSEKNTKKNNPCYLQAAIRYLAIKPTAIPFFYNIFDQRLFYCYEKLSQPVHKKVIKIKK